MRVHFVLLLAVVGSAIEIRPQFPGMQFPGMGFPTFGMPQIGMPGGIPGAAGVPPVFMGGMGGMGFPGMGFPGQIGFPGQMGFPPMNMGFPQQQQQQPPTASNSVGSNTVTLPVPQVVSQPQVPEVVKEPAAQAPSTPQTSQTLSTAQTSTVVSSKVESVAEAHKAIFPQDIPQVAPQQIMEMSKWAELMGMPKLSEEDLKKMLDIQASMVSKLQSLSSTDINAMRAQQNSLAEQMDSLLKSSDVANVDVFQSKQESLMNEWAAKLGLPPITAEEHELMHNQIKKMFTQFSTLPASEVSQLTQKHDQIKAMMQRLN